MVTLVWLEGDRGQRGEWRCAAMEYGGLSVMVDIGTPWMPLWCAGSCATSMKVRTLTLLSCLMKVSTLYTPLNLSIASYKNLEVCYLL